jgi:predicted nucleotidyltransferase
MNIEEIRSKKFQLYQIAAKYGIKQVFIFGSVARGDSNEVSDIDFLVELDENASVFGVGGFQYDAQKLLGVEVDVIPTFVLPSIDDQNCVQTIQAEAIKV